MPIGGKCCIEPLFIGQKYIEVIREGFLHDKQDDNPIRIITKTSMFQKSRRKHGVRKNI